MALLSHADTAADDGFNLVEFLARPWLLHRSRKISEAEAVARYRTMTGMDEPLEFRAKRARENAEKVPLTAKTW
ncbi:hypothetical protein ABT304_03960 [Nocardioides sp. NPDC000445]|uniref:hypothetical protein n=1 Tax=Nocardioides sp. NPDC000445 TaxID=3154257 RepID=UPI00332A57D7